MSHDDAAGLDGGNPLLVVVEAVSLDAGGTFPHLACAWPHRRHPAPRHRLLQTLQAPPVARRVSRSVAHRVCCRQEQERTSQVRYHCHYHSCDLPEPLRVAA